MAEPEEIRIDVVLHEHAWVKIAWIGLRQNLVTYLVSRSTLEDSAEKVRIALEQLVYKYVGIEKKSNQSGVGGDKALHHAGKELRELARAGYDLFESFFLIAEESPSTAEGFKEWFAERAAYRASEGKQINLNFTVDSEIYIPWGLLYDADLDELTGRPEDDSITTYQDFWCLKYKVVSSYNKVTEHERDDSDPPYPMSVLSVAHKAKYEEALTQFDLGLQEKEKQLIEPRRKVHELLESRKKPLFTSHEFYSEWKEHGEKLRVLYFYCHADGSNLALDAHDSISVHDFKRRTRRTRHSQSCLVFLNGCVTAKGDSKGGFLEATSASTFCGFIGTETVVPDIFALRFGLDFLYYFFCKGWTVSQIMDHLRTEHWPLGLIYSTYCRRDFSTGQAIQPLELSLAGNFSEIPLLGSVRQPSAKEQN